MQTTEKNYNEILLVLYLPSTVCVNYFLKKYPDKISIKTL